MIIENENGLKGQHNLAQGKRSGAVRLSSRRSLGLENGHKNRPRENVHKGENLISDEMDDHIFPRNYIIQFASRISSTQFRPKIIICFVHHILADGFSSVTFTQGGVPVRSSRNSALGYDILAFQAGRNAVINLCIMNSSFSLIFCW